MRYFGHWDAPVVDEGEQVPTPVGQRCFYFACPSPVIEEGDNGLVLATYSGNVVTFEPIHLACMLATVAGPELGLAEPFRERGDNG